MHFISIAIVLTMLWACNNKANNKTSKTDKQATEVDTSANKNLEDSFYDGFLIQNQSLDFLVISEALPNPIPDFISYEISEKMISEEGVEIIEKSFVVKDNGKIVFSSQLSGDVVNEIRIFSDIAQTDEGTGVGTSLVKLLEIYPDTEMQYSYVSDKFFATSSNYPNVQFILNNDAYTGDSDKLADSDLVILQADEFNESSTVIEVRIY